MDDRGLEDMVLGLVVDGGDNANWLEHFNAENHNNDNSTSGDTAVATHNARYIVSYATAE